MQRNSEVTESKKSLQNSSLDFPIAESKELPKWSASLDTFIPGFLFSPFPLFVKEPAEGLQELIKDCSRNRAEEVEREGKKEKKESSCQILFSGQPHAGLPDLSKEASIEIALIKAVLEGNENKFLENKNISEIKKLEKQIKDVNDFNNKLKEYLGEKGALLTLMLFDQGEFAPYKFMLQTWLFDKFKHVFVPYSESSKERSTIEFKYEESKNVYTIEAVSNGILVQNLDGPNLEQIERGLRGVVIATRTKIKPSITSDGKLEVKPESELTRELYTSSKNPYFLQELLAFYIENFTKAEASLAEESKAFKKEEKLPSKEFNKFAQEIRENSEGSLLLAKKGNNDKSKMDDLIKKLISTRIQKESVISTIQSRLNKLSKLINVEDKADENTINWENLYIQSITVSSYCGLLTFYPDDPSRDFDEVINQKLKSLEDKSNNLLQSSLASYIENLSKTEVFFAEKSTGLMSFLWQQRERKLPSKEFENFAKEIKVSSELSSLLAKKSNDEKSKMLDFIKKLIHARTTIDSKIVPIHAKLNELRVAVADQDQLEKDEENLHILDSCKTQLVTLTSANYLTLLKLCPDDPSHFDSTIEKQLKTLGDKLNNLEGKLKNNLSLKKVGGPS